MAQLEEEQPPQDDPATGVVLPWASLATEAKREGTLREGRLHVGQCASSWARLIGRINSNLAPQPEQRYS